MKSFNKFILLFCLSLIFSYSSYSQLTAITRTGGIGKLWMQFGYNRAYFFPSDIKFTGEGYKFTVSKAKANDDWKFSNADSWDKEIPQFTYRIGYFFNSEEMFGLEAGYTWVNYVLPPNAKVKVKGTINDSLFNGDAYLTNDFLRYSHSNGSGYLELKAVKGFLIYGNSNYSHMFFALAKAGGGFAITRTNVTLFGDKIENNFALSGFTGTIEGTGKYTYNSHWNFETGFKANFVDYNNVLTLRNGSASHYVISLHWIVAIGFEVRL
jgi:hypothetical protein